MGVTVYSRRPFGYKLGFVLMLFSVVLFLSGFSSPYWYKLTTAHVYIHGGLWQNCVQVLLFRICGDTPKGTMGAGWMTWVQGLQCAGLAGLMMTLVYGIVINCVMKRPKHSRLMEVSGMISSTLALAGAAVFIYHTQSDARKLKQLTRSLDIVGTEIKHTVAWALGVDLAACIICLISYVIIAINNSSIPEDDIPDVIGYTDPETGAIYPVIDASSQVYYIPQPSMPGGFHPVASPFSPPTYETAVSTCQYAAPPYSQYPPK